MKSRHSWRLLAILAINVVWLGLLLWSSTETLPVSVLVQPNQVVANVGGTIVAAPAATSGKGVGFFLQGADPNLAMAWTTAPAPVQPGLLDLPARLAAESAWANARIVSGNGNAVSIPNCLATAPGTPADRTSTADESCPTAWSGDWFRHPLGGLTTEQPGAVFLAPAAPFGDTYSIKADLLRPRNAAGILVDAADGANGMLLYFRPEDRDIVWYQVENGSLVGPVASAPYNSFNKTAVSGVQDVLRELLGGYPAALVIVAMMLVLGRGGEASPSPRRRVAVSPRLSFSVPDLVALLIALAGLGLFLYVADGLLERMPHVQDSVAYLFQAKTFALGRLWVPTPPDPGSFMHEFIVMKDGRWFSKYPPGWPMVLALGVVAGAPWVVDPILGALCLYLLYRIGREVYNAPVGLLAALLGLAAPFVIFLSGSMMAHTSGLFFTLLMVYGVVRLDRGGRQVPWGVVTGVAFGMLFLVRPFSGLMVALPFAILAALQIVRAPGDSLRKWLPVALAALPFAIAFLAYNKVFTGSFTYPPQQLWWPFDQVGFGPDHGPFGFTPIGGLNNTARNLAQLLSHGYGWPPFLTLSLAGIPFLSGRAKKWDWLFLGGFLFLIAGYACWWADGIMYGPRFYFEGFGFLILLTARGVATAIEIGAGVHLDEHNPLSLWERVRVRALPATAAMGLLVVALVAFNLVFYLPGQWQLYHGYNYTNRQQQDLVEKNLIHNAVVFVDPGPWYAWWDYGSVFSANDPLLQGDVIYARDLGADANQQVEQDFPNRSAYLLKDGQITLISPPRKPHPTFCGPDCPSRG